MPLEHAQQDKHRHSESDTVDLPLGAHLMTGRHGYVHHGIYAGQGRVIHYAGFARALQAGPVEETSLEAFAAGRAVIVRLEPCARFVGIETVARARSRLGENRYRLFSNNCEHFCSWCLSGESRSEQVETCLRHPRAALRAMLRLVGTVLQVSLRAA
ncbi:hypothetical protein LMG23992_02783 [Cupriavidus laharis]|uniref:LRAT domain-containing protein n=1 Tax=Cupriavidus laharis TaxID=151654 RepID=A0ABM8X4E2_9BURK|nr:lecithin retinol acyltransferase family protein [Cupriavidus laharis]CAG9174776.1 hypothetical protein LMG23992_02783 [Cupriavidus laharis]